MIITNIVGGLGNQMFQYAIAKAIACKKGDAFKIDISCFSKQKLRKYELNNLNIIENIATSEEIELLAGKETFLLKLKRKIGLKQMRLYSYYKEKEIAVFDENIFRHKDSIYLDGYWQSELYFKKIRKEILKDFTLKENVSDVAKIYIEQIKNTNSISLHVRRGDYVKNHLTNSVHGVCDINYYTRAIDYIKTYEEDTCYFIFSDDILWCKESFDFIRNKYFVEETENAFEDLELMKNCKHNIIANSTFSWWGAWLNQNSDKIVIAPKRWFSDDKMQEQAKDLLPEEWLRV